MEKPHAGRNIWGAYEGYQSADLGSPNILEWVQAKRLRALFRVLEPTLKIPHDPEKRLRSRRGVLTRAPVP